MSSDELPRPTAHPPREEQRAAPRGCRGPARPQAGPTAKAPWPPLRRPSLRSQHRSRREQTARAGRGVARQVVARRPRGSPCAPVLTAIVGPGHGQPVHLLRRRRHGAALGRVRPGAGRGRGCSSSCRTGCGGGGAAAPRSLPLPALAAPWPPPPPSPAAGAGRSLASPGPARRLSPGPDRPAPRRSLCPARGPLREPPPWPWPFLSPIPVLVYTLPAQLRGTQPTSAQP